ncbi:DUF3422 domain-containing protein [Dechloromonas sp. XY25]|uniref:DUF3422 domain-containing protein n=1 Tax=Dechloromonas hankyongensis TaxID=2908002 RepID=A0ABS9K5U2_9RHOO|nr:DUF3422 domain-containing protein [Dechloromonas hankyongensis]MCG2578526.1 DUF3422 domain-containing protein [Dechloromonas hankyongensis]
MHPRLALSELQEHPLRQRLNNEFHARPPVPLVGAMLVSHLVFKHSAEKAPAARDNLAKLCQGHVCNSIESSDSHLMIDTGAFRMRWELHTEFSSYTFFRPLASGEELHPDVTAFDAVLPEWFTGIPGKLIVATHVELRSTEEISPDSILASLTPNGRTMVAAKVADDTAWIFTDFKIDNGFSRFLVLNEGMTQRQTGRTVQRLVEIETYRLMALLGLPVAKEVSRWLYTGERELAEMMDRIGQARSAQDERDILAALSALAAGVEHSVARTTFRFGASRAYHGLVMQRIEELRETRISGLPTFYEFMQRRLLPAMNTCEAISRRQEELSARVARNSQLLRTRVDIELERQNQELLAQMNRRAKLQLHLQEAVEGLSVVVLTYYGSQLVQYIAKGTKELHHLNTDVITAISIPVIAGLVAWGTRRMRRKLAREVGEAA